ncbi:hypothetical protein [Streptomyces sp. NPDC000229]|uniref:hypothetical protein n=1 Tax=Streptomyces sp. NPDC000229 TaxID=3154247 RepID=UPI00331ED19C
MDIRVARRRSNEESLTQVTSGGLLLSAGWSMLRAARDEDGLRHARRTGVGTALTFLIIDLVYVPQGRIRATYLMDAAKEAAWLAAWWQADRLDGDGGRHGRSAERRRKKSRTTRRCPSGGRHY